MVEETTMMPDQCAAKDGLCLICPGEGRRPGNRTPMVH